MADQHLSLQSRDTMRHLYHSRELQLQELETSDLIGKVSREIQRQQGRQKTGTLEGTVACDTTRANTMHQLTASHITKTLH